MRQRSSPRAALPNNLSTEAGGLDCPKPASASVATPLAGTLNRSSLTRSQSLTVEQRRHVLERREALIAQGMTRAEAAKELRVGITTLWRWSSRRIVPETNLCGRASALEKFNPPAEVLACVRQLQLTGKGNAAAWRAVAEDPICPPKLASHIRNSKSVPASLLKATKLTKRKATIVEGPEFQHVVKSRGEAR